MRKWNFCAGPAVISEDVLLEVQSETLEYNDIPRDTPEYP